jgi:hypothetical protein
MGCHLLQCFFLCFGSYNAITVKTNISTTDYLCHNVLLSCEEIAKVKPPKGRNPWRRYVGSFRYILDMTSSCFKKENAQ